MKLYALLERARTFPIFSIADCQKWFPETSRGVLLTQLAGYTRQGHLQRLRRGLYLWPQEPLPHPYALAAALKPESIITLESVLSEAGILPETAFAVTAITDQRGGRTTLPDGGTFLFRHVDSALLFGWRLFSSPPYTARVVYPEKALLDLLWFHQRERDQTAYWAGLRLSFPASFSWSRFRQFACLMPSDRLRLLARNFERIYH